MPENKTAQPVMLTLDMDVSTALGLVATGKVPTEAFLEWDAARQERLKAKFKAESKVAGKLTFKVSEKGAVSVYGMSARFPMTLYVGQWERLFAQLPELQEFIKANDSKLSRKS